jgi:phosphatidylglycerol:prolipoprotein diacylglycerol transferase
MHPELGRIGPVVLRSYTVLINLGLLIGLGLLAWRGRQLQGRAVPWLDVGLSGAAGGLVGARALHVILHWSYFRVNAGEILRVWTGGLAWHGALIGALVAGYAAARLLKVPIGPLADVLAVALSISAALAWWGCRLSNCAYGQEVRSLADYPAPLVAELPDLYFTVAPRFDTQLFGIAWSLLTLGVAGLLTLIPNPPLSRGERGLLKGRRLWAVLAFYSLGNLLISGLRGDTVPVAAGLRIDQWFDLAVIVGCVAGLVVTRFFGNKHMAGEKMQ